MSATLSPSWWPTRKAQARDAAEAVVVDYETLPVVTEAVDALKDGAPQLHPTSQEQPDLRLGNRRQCRRRCGDRLGAHVTEMKIVNNRLVPNPMEPRAALGVYDEADDHYTLWTTSQNPHVARLVLSAFYNVAPENKLRVIAPDVGGGFGSKIYIYPEEIVCLWASKRTGVPVKWNCRPDRSLPDRCAWPRPCLDHQDGV
jgi:carbon-monoxide dehydrogenase large subunit